MTQQPAAEDRESLVRALLQDIAVVTDVAQRLGHTFAAGHALHGTDFRALSFIHASELQGRQVTPAMLGSRLGLSSGAVTYLLDRLEDAGHASRVRDPRDRRRILVGYADPGRALAVEFFGPLVRRQLAALEGVDDAELVATRRVLAAVVEALRGHELELGAKTSTQRSGGPRAGSAGAD